MLQTEALLHLSRQAEPCHCTQVAGFSGSASVAVSSILVSRNIVGSWASKSTVWGRGGSMNLQVDVSSILVASS